MPCTVLEKICNAYTWRVKEVAILTAHTRPTRVCMAPSLSPASVAFSVKKKYTLSLSLSSLSGMRWAAMNLGSAEEEVRDVDVDIPNSIQSKWWVVKAAVSVLLMMLKIKCYMLLKDPVAYTNDKTHSPAWHCLLWYSHCTNCKCKDNKMELLNNFFFEKVN